MEIFALRSIIAVPEELKDWIWLRHYEGLNFAPSLSPDAPTLESITLQRRKHQETLRLHRILQAEATRNAALIQQLKSLLSSPPQASSSQIVPKHEPRQDPDMGEEEEESSYSVFAFLQQKADLATTSAATPLSTTAAFALSQLPAMKALLADLRPALKTLSSPHAHAPDPNLSAAGQGDGKSWREQRLEYVELQTRRLHENVRGLELGPQGAVRDGEWQEEGRRVGRVEVEALERVVGFVGGNGEEMDEGT
jgi:kinetochore protein Mis12/MTW1